MAQIDVDIGIYTITAVIMLDKLDLEVGDTVVLPRLQTSWRPKMNSQHFFLSYMITCY